MMMLYKHSRNNFEKPGLIWLKWIEFENNIRNVFRIWLIMMSMTSSQGCLSMREDKKVTFFMTTPPGSPSGIWQVPDSSVWNFPFSSRPFPLHCSTALDYIWLGELQLLALEVWCRWQMTYSDFRLMQWAVAFCRKYQFSGQRQGNWRCRQRTLDFLMKSNP